MAMVGIGVERHVADQAEFRELALQQPGGPAHQVVRVAGFGALGVLFLRRRGGEQGERGNAQLRGRRDMGGEAVERDALHAGHRAHFGDWPSPSMTKIGQIRSSTDSRYSATSRRVGAVEAVAAHAGGGKAAQMRGVVHLALVVCRRTVCNVRRGGKSGRGADYGFLMRAAALRRPAGRGVQAPPAPGLPSVAPRPNLTLIMPHIPFDNSYARLPPRLYARRDPTPVPAPALVRLNVPLARQLGLDPAALASPEGVAVLAGNRVPEGAEPIALAYAGHQFGQFVPQLGDGRAILLGEVVGRDGARHDIQLKGSGRTPFSRGGDGRAALGPVLREYIVSEAMAALGVPTTRALAAVTTGQPVLRESVLPGAVLTRVAASHLRVGTFQYFAVRGDSEAVRLLADHAIARHYPEAAAGEHPYRALLAGVVAGQAALVARWLLIGFIHGVMNTDNTSIAGETIDYGPCAFLDPYDPGTVFSSIDHAGRYAYGNQPRIAHWNLVRFAETLLPLLGETQETAVAAAQAALASFAPRFDRAYRAGLQRKLGLRTDREGDGALAQDLLTGMAENGADFTLTFRLLCDAAAGTEGDAAVRALFADPGAYDGWAARWRRRLLDEPADPQARRAAMRAANPAFIPRNHIVQAALAAAIGQQDFVPFEALLEVLSRPFDDQPGRERYAAPPKPEERVTQTFCGT